MISLRLQKTLEKLKGEKILVMFSGGKAHFAWHC